MYGVVHKPSLMSSIVSYSNRLCMHLAIMLLSVYILITIWGYECLCAPFILKYGDFVNLLSVLDIYVLPSKVFKVCFYIIRAYLLCLLPVAVTSASCSFEDNAPPNVGSSSSVPTKNILDCRWHEVFAKVVPNPLQPGQEIIFLTSVDVTNKVVVAFNMLLRVAHIPIFIWRVLIPGHH